MKKADYLTHITDRRNRNLKFFSLFCIFYRHALHALIFIPPIPIYRLTILPGSSWQAPLINIRFNVYFIVV